VATGESLFLLVQEK